MFKKKHNVGHHVDQQWVFGMYDTDRKNGLGLGLGLINPNPNPNPIQEWILTNVMKQP